MNLIEQWIALFFDRLPYSEEAAEARGKIERALQNTAPDAAPDDWKALPKYGSASFLRRKGFLCFPARETWREAPDLLRDHTFLPDE